MNLINNIRKVNNISHMLMILTTIHHIYGAYRYHTPERLHVMFLSIPVILLTATLTYFLKKNTDRPNKTLLLIYLAIIMICSLGLIGLFEGVYNHILKNILYFAGTSNTVMRLFFQSDLYEMPNDAIFEITGIGQGLLAVSLLLSVITLVKTWMRQPGNDPGVHASQ